MKRSLSLALIVIAGLLLWPLHASAAPPAPQGTLVYSDDFSNTAKSGLDDNIAATDYSRGFHAPGVYHLRLLQPNDMRLSLFPNQSYGDFTYEAYVWDNSDTFTGDASGGIVFRATDTTHGYAVLFNARDGKYTVVKMDGAGKTSDITPWTASALIKANDGINVLRVDVGGNTFNIYLNNELLTSFSDGSYTQGGIGVIAANIDATQPHFHYDNIKVYTAAATTAGGTNTLPTTGEPTPPVYVLLALLAVSLLGAGVWIRRRAPDS